MSLEQTVPCGVCKSTNLQGSPMNLIEAFRCEVCKSTNLQWKTYGGRVWWIHCDKCGNESTPKHTKDEAAEQWSLEQKNKGTEDELKPCWVIEPAPSGSGVDEIVIFIDPKDPVKSHHEAKDMAILILEGLWDASAYADDPEEVDFTVRMYRDQKAESDLVQE